MPSENYAVPTERSMFKKTVFTINRQTHHIIEHNIPVHSDIFASFTFNGILQGRSCEFRCLKCFTNVRDIIEITCILIEIPFVWLIQKLVSDFNPCRQILLTHHIVHCANLRNCVLKRTWRCILTGNAALQATTNHSILSPL